MIFLAKIIIHFDFLTKALLLHLHANTQTQFKIGGFALRTGKKWENKHHDNIVAYWRMRLIHVHVCDEPCKRKRWN